MLAAWFGGCETGSALADLLTGTVSPSARTPVSWPRALGQVPIFFGQRPTGRPANPDDHYTSKYLDVPNTPLFPFGHGLTYGRFTYADLQMSQPTLARDDTLTVSVDVTNGGARAAEETVFLFIHDKVAQVTRPLLEMKGFQKIALDPGATGTATFTLSGADFQYPGPDLALLFEPGEVEILAGPAADRTRLLVQTIRLI